LTRLGLLVLNGEREGNKDLEVGCGCCENKEGFEREMHYRIDLIKIVLMGYELLWVNTSLAVLESL